MQTRDLPTRSLPSPTKTLVTNLSRGRDQPKPPHNNGTNKLFVATSRRTNELTMNVSTLSPNHGLTPPLSPGPKALRRSSNHNRRQFRQRSNHGSRHKQKIVDSLPPIDDGSIMMMESFHTPVGHASYCSDSSSSSLEEPPSTPRFSAAPAFPVAPMTPNRVQKYFAEKGITPVQDLFKTASPYLSPRRAGGKPRVSARVMKMLPMTPVPGVRKKFVHDEDATEQTLESTMHSLSLHSPSPLTCMPLSPDNADSDTTQVSPSDYAPTVVMTKPPAASNGSGFKNKRGVMIDPTAALLALPKQLPLAPMLEEDDEEDLASTKQQPAAKMRKPSPTSVMQRNESCLDNNDNATEMVAMPRRKLSVRRSFNNALRNSTCSAASSDDEMLLLSDDAEDSDCYCTSDDDDMVFYSTDDASEFYSTDHYSSSSDAGDDKEDEDSESAVEFADDSCHQVEE